MLRSLLPTRHCFVLGLVLPACAPVAPPQDEAGRESGPCIDSECLGALTCLSDVCVDAREPEAGATSGADSTQPGGSTGAADDAQSTATSVDDDTTGTPGATASGSDDAVVDGSDDGRDFIVISDGAQVSECSPWEQDCPRGEKCSAWASELDGTWNANACFVVVDEPDAVGEPCVALGGPASGLDSCDVGAICWGADGPSGMGECLAFCGGSSGAPECPADLFCSVSNEGVLPLCQPSCDPVLQNCPEGQGCYLGDGDYNCTNDASGGAGFGQGCDFINACAAGYACLPPAIIGDCTAGGGCCTPFCDLDGEDACPGEGQTCMPVFEPPPTGLEHVGVCLLP